MAIAAADILIIGCGPGSSDYITPAARQALDSADVVAGSRRLLDLFAKARGERLQVDAHMDLLLCRIADRLARNQRVAVLVSGDVGLCSLAQTLIRRFGRQRCRLIPGISSVQVAFARAGLDWADARILSAHGRVPQVPREELARADKIAVLIGTREGQCWAADLATDLQKSHIVFLCENLTLENECIRQMTAAELGACRAESLAIVLLVRRTLL